jgi:WD40 repeat protein
MGYASQWSPFNQELIAVAQNKHFGFVGAGSLEIYHTQLSSTSTTGSPTVSNVKKIASHTHSESIYDVAWSEKDNNIIAFSTVNGVLLWNIVEDKILHTFNDHSQEVYSIGWNPLSTSHLLSGSWDSLVKLYDTTHLSTAISSFSTNHAVNVVDWNPQYGDLFASAGLSTEISLWDVNSPSRALARIDIKNAKLAKDTQAANEINTIAFDKYNSNLLYCGPNDNGILVYDIRNIKAPIISLTGHELGIKKIVASPHQSGVFLSSSYDISIGIWDLSKTVDGVVGVEKNGISMSPYLIGRYEEHQEFAFGLGFHPTYPTLVASTSFDNTLDFWDYKQFLQN